MRCTVCNDTLTESERGHFMCGRCWLEMEVALIEMGAVLSLIKKD